MTTQRLLTFALVGATGLLAAQGAVRHFKPPRTAIVDTFEVIEKYEKKAFLENELRQRVEVAEGEMTSLERKANLIDAELKLLEEGTPEYRDQLLRKTKIQLDLKDLQTRIGRELQEHRMAAIEEIRKEVEAEIETYSRGNEIDLVLEKKIPIEGRGEVKINIPIVRYVNPEIEITREIAEILNARYRRTSRSRPVGSAIQSGDGRK